VLLWATFLAMIALAPVLAGRLYQSQQAAAARLHPATAVLTENGPGDSYGSSSGEASARWRAPGGQRRSGTLTTLTAPGILGVPAGSSVTVWLTSSGRLAIDRRRLAAWTADWSLTGPRWTSRL